MNENCNTPERDTIRLNIPFHQVPNNIFELGLTAHQLVVMHYICRCGNQGAGAWPSHKTIADKCGINKRTVIRTLSSLYAFEYEGKAILEKQARYNTKGDMTSNEYIVNLPEIYFTEKDGGDSQTLPSDSQTLPLVTDRHPIKNPVINNSLQRTNIHTDNELKKIDDVKKVYGEFENVRLSDAEYSKLVEKFGTEKECNDRIESLSAGIASKGYKYKDFYATILSWARKEQRDGGAPSSITGGNGKKPRPRAITAHNEFKSPEEDDAEYFDKYTSGQYGHLVKT